MANNILNSELEQYLHELEDSVPRTPVLRAMEVYAREHGFPIIGPLVGRMVATVTHAIRAKRVLELGSGYGYSAIWFASAIGNDGSILCTDGDEANRTRALSYFHDAEVTTPVDFRVGDALTIARTLSAPFDIVFNDIDKHEYPDVIEEAARLLRIGGVFFTDNVLWSARIINSSINDRNTDGIREFNRRIFSDNRFSTTILPIRDGVAMAVKVSD